MITILKSQFVHVYICEWVSVCLYVCVLSMVRISAFLLFSSKEEKQIGETKLEADNI